MTLALTTSLSATITKSELESNFTTIQNKFNAGIDNTDIKSSAAIDISKLSASKEYVTINLYNSAYTWGSAGATIAIAPLPGQSGSQANWTLVDAGWFVSDNGSAAGTIDVALAYYNSSGVLTDTSVLINEESMTVSGGGDGTGNAGDATIDASAVAYHGSDTRLFVLRQGATTGTGVLNAAGFIGVTLLLERALQA